MRLYETIFILKHDLNEDEVNAQIKRVEDILKRADVELMKIENLGEKKLPYQIKKSRYGVFMLLHFRANPAFVPELERHFRLSEYIIKYLTIRLDEKASPVSTVLIKEREKVRESKEDGEERVSEEEDVEVEEVV
ncbi:MAG: 30S ribosomal protein S6 [Candidatus Tectomicrobia bacterium]|nr:30S ribosomal protein S6 [Candidatus Tectomicrobia bacterium]